MNESQIVKASPLRDSQIHEDKYLRGDDLLGHTIGGSKTEPSGSVDTVYSSAWLRLRCLCIYAKGFFFWPLKSVYSVLCKFHFDVRYNLIW